MASNNQRAHVAIVLDGVQAERILKALAEEAKNVATQLKEMEAAGKVNTKEYEDLLRYQKQINGEVRKNSKQMSDLDDVMKNLATQTSRQLEAALRTISKVMKDVDASTDEGRKKMAELTAQEEAIAQRNQILKGGFVEVANVIKNLGTESTKHIQQAIRQLEFENTLVAKNTAEYKQNYQQIVQLNKELDKRNGKMTGQRASQLATGSMTGSSKELKEALDYYKQLRENLKEDNTQGLQMVDQKIAALTKRIGDLSGKYIDVKNVLRNVGDVSNETLTRAYDQQKKYVDSLSQSDPLYKQELANLNRLNTALEVRNGKMNAVTANRVYNNAGASADELKRTIEYYERLKSTVAATNTRGIDRLTQRITELRRRQIESIQSQQQFNAVMANLKTAPIEQLRAAEARLVEEIRHATGEQRDYADKAKQLQQVRAQIQGLTGDFQKQESSLKQVASRLAAYVGVYGAFNFIRGQVTQLIQKNLQFSDTLSDIRKTTLMSEEAVGLLSDRLKELDTRTSVIDVQKLAYEAGKLGITGVANVTEFVKAADQVNIALGEQLNGLESITELMKINQVLGTTQQYGIEQSLLKTGSAINYLSQTSTAVGSRMTDFTARLAGISASANISTAEVLGLSAASDALKQQVEVSATAFNKLISQMFTKTKTVADAVGLEFDTLKEKLEMGDTMDALLMVLDAVRKKGGLSETGPIMKDLGSDGARLLQVLNAMANNVDFVRDSVNRANKAFREGTSVTNEYNIKNENAAALWERLKNNMEKYFVSASNTGWFKEIIQDLQELPKWIDRMAVGLWPVKLAVEAVVWSLKEMSYVWAAFITGFTVSKVIEGLGAVKVAFNAWTLKIKEAEGAANKLKAAFNTNVYTIILTAISAVAYAAWDNIKKAREQAAAFGKAVASAYKEAAIEAQKLHNIQTEAEPVFKRVEQAQKALAKATEEYGKNSEQAKKAQSELAAAETDRRVAISNFNDKYSTYLGYQLAETANYNDMAKAIDAVNSKLRMKALLNAKGDRETAIINETQQGIEESYIGTRSAVAASQGQGDAAAAEAIRYMREHPEEFLQDMGNGKYQAYGNDNKNTDRVAALAKILGLSELDYQEGMKILSKFQSLVNQANAQKQKIADSNAAFEAEMDVDARAHEKEVAPQVGTMWQQIKDFVDKTDEEQLKIMKSQNADVRDKRKKQVQAYLEAARLQAEDLQHMTDADSQARLVELQKAISRSEAYLEKQPINTNPTQKETDEANREALRGARDEYNAIISKVEAFYQMQRQVVNEQYEKQQIDTVERENALREIEQRLLQSRIAARKRIVDKATDQDWQAEQQFMSSFNKAGEEGVRQLESIASVSLTKIGTLLKNLGGDAEWDAIFRKAEEDETKQQDLRIKRIIEIEKIMLEHNALGKVTNEYQKTLRELDLISSRFMEQGETDLAAYYRRMMQIALAVGKQAGSVDLNTDAGMQQGREVMIQSGMSDEQANSMSPTEVKAFFYQAYKYSEQYAQTSQQLAKKTLDAWEKTYDTEGNADYFDRRIEKYQQMAKIAERMEQYGLAESVALENQLDAATALYAKEKSRLDAKMERARSDRQAAENINDDPTRRNEEISKADEEIAMVEQEYEKLIPLYEKMMDAAVSLEEYNHRWVVSMKDSFTELFDSFIDFRSFYEDKDGIWENVLGTTEDRQKAFGDFIDSIKKATRQAIMEKVRQRLSTQLQDKIELSWSKMFQKQKSATEAAGNAEREGLARTFGTAKVAIEQQTGAQELAAKRANNAASETEEAGHMTKNVAMGEASAIAKCFGELGPIAGAVAVGLVTAVIGTFLTMALNAIGHSDHGSSASAGAKTKLVSGMLTYDEGNAQTVLGPTGKAYSAITDPNASGLVTRPTITTVQGAPALVAEEGPELVVGRETTRALMMDHPNIVRTIMALEARKRHHSARMSYAYDEGNAASVFSGAADGSGASDNSSLLTPNSSLSDETVQALVVTMAALSEQLSRPIKAEFNMNGKGGAADQIAQGLLNSKRLGDLDSVKRLLGTK